VDRSERDQLAVVDTDGHLDRLESNHASEVVEAG